MGERPAISIDIVSDVMCPWCYIGKKRLEKAAELTPDIDLIVRWRPFQLDATLPKEGTPRETYITEKFGSTERYRELSSVVEEAGRGVGIPFAFDAIERSPNTLDCHRLLRWAGPSGRQHALAERLFSLYFVEGADLSDPATLIGAARAVGMETDGLAERLASEEDVELTRAEIAHAQRIGVTGVPCFILDGKYAAMGAQDPEVLASAFRDILVEREKAEA